MRGGESVGMGFDAAQFIGLDTAQAGEAVGGAPAEQFVETGQFFLAGGDDQFAADLMGNVMVPAEGDHFPNACDGQSGLERSGFVVETAVEDA